MNRMIKRSPRITFSAQPVYNALASIHLTAENPAGVSEWVVHTHEHMSDAERRDASMVMLTAEILPPTPDEELPTWVERFAELRPREIYPRVVELLLAEIAHEGIDIALPPLDRAVADRALLYSTLESAWVSDPEAGAKARAIVDRVGAGAEYRDAMVALIRSIWTESLADEWARNESMVAASVDALSKVPVTGTFAERILRLTRRDNLPDWWLSRLQEVTDIVYIPSPHVGPYLLMIDAGPVAYVTAKARIPAAVVDSNAPDVDRSDLLVRLAALGDETRLAILEVARREGEITTPLIMERLGLTQSSASRHLMQLAATGLLSVNANEKTKRYRQNPRRVQEIARGITDLLG